jgi:hypothetical protein
MKTILNLFFLLMCISIECIGVIKPIDSINGDDIKIYRKNPWYWEYKGEPLLLLGGSYEDNMFQFPNRYYEPGGGGLVDWTLEEHLDKLVESGGNYLRNTMSPRKGGNRWPFKKITGTPGVNLATDVYDLDQWDDVFWERFDTFLSMCEAKDIIVQIEIWDPHDFHRPESKHNEAIYRGLDNSGWEASPFNPLRNINYTQEESGLFAEIDFTAGPNPTPHTFFYSVPALSQHQYACEPIVLKYQEAYVNKLLDISFKYGNVLYCANNESNYLVEWGEHWVQFIKDKAKSAEKLIYVSDMRRNNDMTSPDQQSLMTNDLFDFFEASQNAGTRDQLHYDRGIYIRNTIKSDAPGIKPINNTKIYGGKTGWTGGEEEGRRRFWRNIFAGQASVRFHRAGYVENRYGIALDKSAQAWIKSARMLTDSMNIFVCEPDNSLLSNRSDNEAFCLAEIGEQYAIYFTDGGSVTLDMSGATGNFTKKWLEIAESEWKVIKTITGGGSQILAPPSSGQWAVLITKQ